jgi:hypothetical protein
MLSYKIETFFQDSIVIDSQINPVNPDDNDCYKYIKDVFKWKVDDYTKGERTVLSALKTGIANLNQNTNTINEYSKSCILPINSRILFTSCNNIDPLKIGKHTLNLNTINGATVPYGYEISFSQPTNNIDYSDENNFKEFLNDSYQYIQQNSPFYKILVPLSNSVLDPVNGTSNIYIKNINELDNIQESLNTVIKNYKNICTPNNNTDFKVLCANDDDLNNINIFCCNKTSTLTILENNINNIKNQKKQINDAIIFMNNQILEMNMIKIFINLLITNSKAILYRDGTEYLTLPIGNYPKMVEFRYDDDHSWNDEVTYYQISPGTTIDLYANEQYNLLILSDKNTTNSYKQGSIVKRWQQETSSIKIY